MSEISELQELIGSFAKERQWESFHTPKNLAMAISGEAGELVAEFQWLSPDESMLKSLSPIKRLAIELEMADVAIYLFRLADVLGTDLADAIRIKMDQNEIRFPL